MTAVEWLLDCLNNYDSKMIELFNYEIERAKEMEKQDIIEAYDKGEFNCGMNESAEQYYNDTFKK